MSAKNAEEAARWGHNISSLEEHDDLSSEWNLVKEAGELWGGRKRGGRGVKCFANTDFVSIESVSMGFPGKELLINSRLKLYPGHKYGLIGENGVGKSTLLRCMARGSIPGFPTTLTLQYVQQEMATVKDTTVLEYICRNMSELLGGVMTVEKIDAKIARLRSKESNLEAQLEDISVSNEEQISELADELCVLAEEIEALEKQKKDLPPVTTTGTASGSDTSGNSGSGNSGEDKKVTVDNVKEIYSALPKEVKSIIKGFGLSKPIERLAQNMDKLSGGWRMRAALAHALIDIDNTDILLLDEPTNHLDIQTVRFLTELLQGMDCILVLVSHDRMFLETVCTDIIDFKAQALTYFPGTYEEFIQNKEKMAARNNNMLDAQTRKEEHIKKSISMAKSRGDDSMVRNKHKKLERAAFHSRLDGKKFKLFTLPKCDINSVKFPERVAAIKANKELRFKFPDPEMHALRLLATSSGNSGSAGSGVSSGVGSKSDAFSSPLITLEKCSITWMAVQPTATASGGSKSTTKSTATASIPVEKHTVLRDLSLQIFPGSRLAVVGENGSGKSTFLAALMQLVSGKIAPAAVTKSAAATTAGNSTVFKATATATKTKAPGISLPSAKKVINYDTVNDDISSSSTADEGGVHLWESEAPGEVYIEGTYHCHHNLRMSMLSQHHFDSLTQFLALSPVQYLLLLSGCNSAEFMPGGVAVDTGLFNALHKHNHMYAGCSNTAADSSFSVLDARAHLGKFGLSGEASLQPIESLSGGQKARLCLSAVMLSKPHVLVLDEPTNHLSIDAIDALIIALKEYAGAVIVVSHNQSLLVNVCTELGVIKNEKLKIVSSVPGADSSSSSGSGGIDEGTNTGNNSKNNSKKKGKDALVVSNKVATFSDLLEAYLLDALK